MKERPILFSAPMVRAILAGTKTQTRRVIKPQPPSTERGRPMSMEDLLKTCPYGAPGDRLWVRECFYIDLMPWDTDRLPSHRPSELDNDSIYYRADGECCQQIPECACAELGRKTPWRPSIHMPRWVSRITLEVTGVRLERLHEITEAEIRAEGFDGHVEKGVAEADFWLSPQSEFQILWNELNYARGFGWDVNPWVWVVSFKSLHRKFKTLHSKKVQLPAKTRYASAEASQS